MSNGTNNLRKLNFAPDETKLHLVRRGFKIALISAAVCFVILITSDIIMNATGWSGPRYDSTGFHLVGWDLFKGYIYAPGKLLKPPMYIQVIHSLGAWGVFGAFLSILSVAALFIAKDRILYPKYVTCPNPECKSGINARIDWRCDYCGELQGEARHIFKKCKTSECPHKLESIICEHCNEEVEL